MSDPANSSPNTVLDVLTKTTDFFRQKEIPDPRLDAQILLAHALNLDRMQLYLKFDQPLTEQELEKCRELVRKRAKRQPLQYIIGYTQFRDSKIKCDSRALIPRPETEQLVDLALEETKKSGKTEWKILDIGTGTGAIAIELARNLPSAEVWASDVSEEALKLARENCELNEVQPHLSHGDRFASSPKEYAWDLITSNPPYVGKSEMPGLQPEVREFEPATALVGGEQGWEFPESLSREAVGRIASGGVMIMEIGLGQSETLKEKCKSHGWLGIDIHKDYSGVDRFLVFRK